MDKLKYKLFYYLWHIWHSRLRWFKPFMRWVPPHYDPEFYTPEEIEALKGTRFEKHGEYQYILDNRPWWHMCCNGDTGGWRTHFCNWLENKWRSTRYYNEAWEDDAQNPWDAVDDEGYPPVTEADHG